MGGTAQIIFVSWRLLLTSTAASLILIPLITATSRAQLSGVENQLLKLTGLLNLTQLKQMVPGAAIDTTAFLPKPNDQLKQKVTQSVHRFMGWIAVLLGWTAKVSTLAAFYYLYRFARMSALRL